MSVQWEEPPPAEPTSWAAIGAELKAHPGRWAVVSRHRSSNSAAQTAYQIRQGKKRALAALGLFEASATAVDHEHRVYARYIGESS